MIEWVIQVKSASGGISLNLHIFAVIRCCMPGIMMDETDETFENRRNGGGLQDRANDVFFLADATGNLLSLWQVSSMQANHEASNSGRQVTRS